MLLFEAIISGIRKPCKHNFVTFQFYKYEWKTIKQKSDNIYKEIVYRLSGNVKITNHKRYIADCPICGKLWLASDNKKTLKNFIKQMNKKYIEILSSESIRYSKKITPTGANK